MSFENDEHRISHKEYHLPSVEIKDHNVLLMEETSLIETY